jgi:hypothetical protein
MVFSTNKSRVLYQQEEDGVPYQQEEDVLYQQESLPTR